MLIITLRGLESWGNLSLKLLLRLNRTALAEDFSQYVLAKLRVSSVIVYKAMWLFSARLDIGCKYKIKCPLTARLLDSRRVLFPSLFFSTIDFSRPHFHRRVQGVAHLLCLCLELLDKGQFWKPFNTTANSHSSGLFRSLLLVPRKPVLWSDFGG